MPLDKTVREYISKYEDVVRTEFKNATFYIYYLVDGKEKFKRLPYRATQKQIVRTIERIRKEINYYKRLKERIDSGYYKVSNNKPVFYAGD